MSPNMYTNTCEHRPCMSHNIVYWNIHLVCSLWTVQVQGVWVTLPRKSPITCISGSNESFGQKVFACCVMSCSLSLAYWGRPSQAYMYWCWAFSLIENVGTIVVNRQFECLGKSFSGCITWIVVLIMRCQWWYIQYTIFSVLWKTSTNMHVLVLSLIGNMGPIVQLVNSSCWWMFV